MITSGFAHQYETEIFGPCKLYHKIKLEENNGLRTAADGNAPASTSHDGSMTSDRGESIGKCTATYHVYHTWQVSYQTPIC